MSRPRYGNNPELVALVRSCMRDRLTYAAAVLRIRDEGGFEITKKKYQRMKSKIKKLDQNRLEHLATVEYPRFTIDTIEVGKKVEDALLDIVEKTKNDWVKISALDSIMKNRKELAQFYDSSPVMAELSKKLQHENEYDLKKESNDLEEHREADKK